MKTKEGSIITGMEMKLAHIPLPKLLICRRELPVQQGPLDACLLVVCALCLAEDLQHPGLHDITVKIGLHSDLLKVDDTLIDHVQGAGLVGKMHLLHDPAFMAQIGKAAQPEKTGEKTDREDEAADAVTDGPVLGHIDVKTPHA